MNHIETKALVGIINVEKPLWPRMSPHLGLVRPGTIFGRSCCFMPMDACPHKGIRWNPKGESGDDEVAHGLAPCIVDVSGNGPSVVSGSLNVSGTEVFVST